MLFTCTIVNVCIADRYCTRAVAPSGHAVFDQQLCQQQPATSKATFLVFFEFQTNQARLRSQLH